MTTILDSGPEYSPRCYECRKDANRPPAGVLPGELCARHAARLIDDLRAQLAEAQDALEETKRERLSAWQDIERLVKERDEAEARAGRLLVAYEEQQDRAVAAGELALTERAARQQAEEAAQRQYDQAVEATRRALQAERERDDAKAQWLDRLAEVDQLRGERDRAVAALRAVEWVHFQEEAAWCPWCHHFETQGHHATCGRQAALCETAP